MYGIAETSLVLCGATTAIYLLIFCVYLVVNRTLQEFKNDKNTQKVLKIAMLSSYVCVLSTVFCAIIAGFKGV
jgi:ABC-type sulfate transport system permease component|nr:MAG TPA: hypothetical protein [Caudoviricetes sp.]DAY93389.1 MAG TPA: hypothetical protein [Caudoviricetes sp.]